MEEMTAPKPRNPLGIPKGSVRALLALTFFGSTMTLLILGRKMDPGLWLVNYVILGYYFASRQEATNFPQPPSTSQPLGLPRGTVRFFLTLGFLGTAGWLGYSWYTNKVNVLQQPAFRSLVSLGAFFLGRFLRPLGKAQENPTSLKKIYQDGKAVTALISGVLLLSLVIFQLPLPEKEGLKMFALTYTLFYFGGR